jgi:hypothetical protein
MAKRSSCHSHAECDSYPRDATAVPLLKLPGIMIHAPEAEWMPVRPMMDWSGSTNAECAINRLCVIPSCVQQLCSSCFGSRSARVRAEQVWLGGQLKHAERAQARPITTGASIYI